MSRGSSTEISPRSMAAARAWLEVRLRVRARVMVGVRARETVGVRVGVEVGVRVRGRRRRWLRRAPPV